MINAINVLEMRYMTLYESVQKQKYLQRQGSMEICENFAHANKT